MTWRPHPKRARTDPTSPRAWGTSDRSGFIGNHENMQFQYQWRGKSLINTRVLVYPDELDVPQRQLGILIIPPDPPPIMNARPEQYFIDEGSFMSSGGNNQFMVSEGVYLVNQIEITPLPDPPFWTQPED